jgi:hypothetical protein
VLNAILYRRKKLFFSFFKFCFVLFCFVLVSESFFGREIFSVFFRLVFLVMKAQMPWGINRGELDCVF